MIGKIEISVAAYHERTGTKQGEGAGFKTALSHRPHGVVAVFGPYNFPAHLPNGHIVPALLAGNTIIYKPSEQTPYISEFVVKLWQEAGLPAGVLNLVQGLRNTGELIAKHTELDGLYFTGSSATGKILHQQFAGSPGKILALELGGNNPLIVWDCADAKAASYHIVQSAFMTTGQRCTCARRLIIPQGPQGDRLLDTLVPMTQSLKIGAYSDTPEPFMGPIINEREAQKLLEAQAALEGMGGKALLRMERPASAGSAPPQGGSEYPLTFVTPAILDVSAVTDLPDREYFGALLQVIRVPDLDTAIAVANNTRFGLSAGIFTDDKAKFERYLREARAGIVNWNRPTTGSSGNLPFGGVGLSGNHRPAAYYSADYCAYPVATSYSEKLELPAALAPGMTL
jgi:succinylglutamic semialdehyde dehydrogenase